MKLLCKCERCGCDVDIIDWLPLAVLCEPCSVITQEDEERMQEHLDGEDAARSFGAR